MSTLYPKKVPHIVMSLFAFFIFTIGLSPVPVLADNSGGEYLDVNYNRYHLDSEVQLDIQLEPAFKDILRKNGGKFVLLVIHPYTPYGNNPQKATKEYFVEYEIPDNERVDLSGQPEKVRLFGIVAAKDRDDNIILSSRPLNFYIHMNFPNEKPDTCEATIQGATLQEEEINFVKRVVIPVPPALGKAIEAGQKKFAVWKSGLDGEFDYLEPAENNPSLFNAAGDPIAIELKFFDSFRSDSQNQIEDNFHSYEVCEIDGSYDDPYFVINPEMYRIAGTQKFHITSYGPRSGEGYRATIDILKLFEDPRNVIKVGSHEIIVKFAEEMKPLKSNTLPNGLLAMGVIRFISAEPFMYVVDLMLSNDWFKPNEPTTDDFFTKRISFEAPGAKKITAHVYTAPTRSESVQRYDAVSKNSTNGPYLDIVRPYNNGAGVHVFEKSRRAIYQQIVIDYGDKDAQRANRLAKSTPHFVPVHHKDHINDTMKLSWYNHSFGPYPHGVPDITREMTKEEIAQAKENAHQLVYRDGWPGGLNRIHPQFFYNHTQPQDGNEAGRVDLYDPLPGILFPYGTGKELVHVIEAIQAEKNATEFTEKSDYLFDAGGNPLSVYDIVAAQGGRRHALIFNGVVHRVTADQFDTSIRSFFKSNPRYKQFQVEHDAHSAVAYWDELFANWSGNWIEKWMGANSEHYARYAASAITGAVSLSDELYVLLAKARGHNAVNTFYTAEGWFPQAFSIDNVLREVEVNPRLGLGPGREWETLYSIALGLLFEKKKPQDMLDKFHQVAEIMRKTPTREGVIGTLFGYTDKQIGYHDARQHISKLASKLPGNNVNQWEPHTLYMNWQGPYLAGLPLLALANVMGGHPDPKYAQDAVDIKNAMKKAAWTQHATSVMLARDPKSGELMPIWSVLAQLRNKTTGQIYTLTPADRLLQPEMSSDVLMNWVQAARLWVYLFPEYRQLISNTIPSEWLYDDKDTIYDAIRFAGMWANQKIEDEGR